MEKICPGCSRVFACRAGRCWCDAIRLSPAALHRLAGSYAGCLCPICLHEASRARGSDPRGDPASELVKAERR